jgi:hypothetical protein
MVGSRKEGALSAGARADWQFGGDGRNDRPSVARLTHGDEKTLLRIAWLQSWIAVTGAEMTLNSAVKTDDFRLRQNCPRLAKNRATAVENGRKILSSA